MYNTSLRIIKDTAEAEDIMQESFLSAFKKIKTFQGDASFGSWLKRIVINNSLTALKKKVRLAEEPLDAQLFKLKEEESSDPWDGTTAEIKQVKKAMDQLNENYRVCLNLHLVEGYDYEEVSQLLEISYANSRTMISRAKASLRKKLASQK